MKKFNRSAILFWLTISILLLAGCRSTGQGGNGNNAGSQDPGAAAYIQNKGSDTIVNLALAWAERYQKIHPEVRVSVTGGGSGTGIASLINGTVDIANASREIKPEEVTEAQKRGVDPQEHEIARDAIAVIVNPNNPINQLTMEEVSQIFRGEINNWKDLGGEDRPIVRVSRETNSGTHVYFLEAVVRLGYSKSKDIFAADTLLLPSSEGIISEVGDNPNAIGYDGLGYVTSQVKVLAVAQKGSQDYILPSAESVDAGTYPISRGLYMYTGKTLKPAVQAYLDWITSEEAQQIVTELGFVPISATPETGKK